MCVYVGTHPYTLDFVSAHWKGLETITNLVEMIIPSTQIVVFILLPIKSSQGVWRNAWF